MRYKSIDCTATVSAADGARTVEVSLVGAVDRDDASMLADVTDHLAGLAPRRIVIELGQLDFAGSALPNWLATMRSELRGQPSVEVRHPQPLVCWVLVVAGMTDLVADGCAS